MNRTIARVSRIVAIVALSALLLVVILALLLATPFGEGFVRRSIERAALSSTGATVSMRELELRPWRLDARAVGLSARRLGAGEEVVYTVEVERARARVDRSGRLHLELEAPVVTVRLQREETERPAGPTLGERLDRARIATLAAANATLHVLDREGVEIVGLDRAAVALERAGVARFAARADAAVRVRAAEERVLDAGMLHAEGEIAGPEIRLAQAKLERPGADLSVRGTLRESPQVDGALEADFRLATDVVRELFPELRATGEVEGTATLALTPEGLSVEADFRGASLSWDAIGPFAAGGRLRLADRRLDLTGGSLAGYGGRADVTASWDLDADRQNVGIVWSGVDLGPLIADFDGPRLPADLAASGEAEIETTAFSREAASGEAQVRLDGRVRSTGAPLAAQARARLEGGDVEIQQSRVELGAGVLAAAGDVSADGRLRGAYQLTWSDLMRLSEVTALVGAPPPPIDLAGALTATGTVGGSLRDPRATASVERQIDRGRGNTGVARSAGDGRSTVPRGRAARRGGRRRAHPPRRSPRLVGTATARAAARRRVRRSLRAPRPRSGARLRRAQRRGRARRLARSTALDARRRGVGAAVTPGRRHPLRSRSAALPRARRGSARGDRRAPRHPRRRLDRRRRHLRSANRGSHRPTPCRRSAAREPPARARPLDRRRGHGRRRGHRRRAGQRAAR